MNQDQLTEIVKRIKKFQSGTLVSLQERNGEVIPVGRPMGVARVSDAAEISTITYRSTEKVDEISDHRGACFAFQDKNALFITVAGKVSFINDESFKERNWSQVFETWFPDGIHDERVIALKLHPQKIEVWESTGLQRAKYLYEVAKARISGTTPNASQVGNHFEVDFEKESARSL